MTIIAKEQTYLRGYAERAFYVWNLITVFHYFAKSINVVTEIRDYYTFEVTMWKINAVFYSMADACDKCNLVV